MSIYLFQQNTILQSTYFLLQWESLYFDLYTMKPYGTIIPNLEIDGKKVEYPVINERGVRATAGFMLLIGVITFFVIQTTGNYLLLNITVVLFWLDFALKTFIHPKASFFNHIGEMLVANQKPEYVGAIQKRFAWGIGFVLASSMIIIALLLKIRGLLPISICMTCFFFMWMESALGICVGCKIYTLLLNKKILPEPQQRPACPGGVCSVDFNKK